MEETWKKVPGYDGLYSVSSLGRVRRDAPSRRRDSAGRIVRATNMLGYRQVCLFTKSGRAYARVHVLVALAFIGPKPTPKSVVNHLDADRANNRPENLEWTTVKGNWEHASRLGLTVKGERQHDAKLTADQVREIRASFANGASRKHLAGKYGITLQNLHYIIHRKTWSQV